LKLKITVGGKVYEVEIEISEPDPPQHTYVPPPGQAHVAAQAPATAPPVPSDLAPVAAEDKVCRSPIGGMVARIPTQVGQSIKVNDVLMVLEAMKMDHTIRAPADGRVDAVHVADGDQVDAGSVLVVVVPDDGVR